jgi:hypothetical protein
MKEPLVITFCYFLKNLLFKKNKNLLMNFSKKIFSIFSLLIIFHTSYAQLPQLHYKFQYKQNTDSIEDISGNNFSGLLKATAKLTKLGSYGILETGGNSGYLDMGTKTGNLIKSLNSFTISTYLYIHPSLNLSANGNFVWCFSNAENILTSPIGCMFYSAKNSRYAISLTNYSAERQININSASEKGAWHHIVYRQEGSNGEIFIDGISRKTGSISLNPASLGTTSFNYLARSSYAGDQYMNNCRYADFRIYNAALSNNMISTLGNDRQKLDTLTFNSLVDSAINFTSKINFLNITTNISLPDNYDNEVAINWSSSNQSYLSNSGIITRPLKGFPDATATLTATFTKGFVTKTKQYQVTILAQYSDLQSVKADSANLVITGNIHNLRSSLNLPTTGIEGATIIWNSSDTKFLSNSGNIVSRPAKGTGKQKITLTATITKGIVSVKKYFDIYIAEDEGFAGYLFTYFTGNSKSQEAIRFAISDDGLVYTALNNNQPVISSATISNTGGVRDPHILRDENGWFYMVVTDMVSANGWNSNRGIVLLKSRDLITWTSAKINIPTEFPAEFADVDRVWAPQTIYDPKNGKFMVYFSMRKGSSDYDKIYYSYTNDDFTKLETVPKQLFFNPAGTACIDGDIIEKDGQFHLFFKTEGSGNGIKKAVSDKLTAGYVLLDKYLDQNANAVEGGCVFRLYNTDEYILMYDVYTSGYYEFTKSSDLENFTVISGNSFDFSPRHGTIIPITAVEMQALKEKWMNTNVKSFTESKVNIYPNPANDFIEIEVEKLNPSKSFINIYDIVGKNLIKTQITDFKNVIDITKLPAGIYFAEVSMEGNKTVFQKFIKQ